MSYLQTLSDTESEPDQTKEVVEPLEKSKPVKKRAPRKPKAKEPEPEPEAEKLEPVVEKKKRTYTKKPKAEPKAPEPEKPEPKPKRKYTKKPKAPEQEPEAEAELVKPKPVKRVPNEKQKQALEKAREIRRAAKLEPEKKKESVEPIVFV